MRQFVNSEGDEDGDEEGDEDEIQPIIVASSDNTTSDISFFPRPQSHNVSQRNGRGRKRGILKGKGGEGDRMDVVDGEDHEKASMKFMSQIVKKREDDGKEEGIHEGSGGGGGGTSPQDSHHNIFSNILGRIFDPPPSHQHPTSHGSPSEEKFRSVSGDGQKGGGGGGGGGDGGERGVSVDSSLSSHSRFSGILPNFEDEEHDGRNRGGEESERGGWEGGRRNMEMIQELVTHQVEEEVSKLHHRLQFQNARMKMAINRLTKQHNHLVSFMREDRDTMDQAVGEGVEEGGREFEELK